VDLFLAISRFVADQHVRAGLPPARIRVKPHFAAAGPAREGPGEHFLYVGRLSEEKGVDTIVRAWGMTRAAGDLVIAGDGPQMPRLRALAPAGVRFLGALPAAGVPPLIARARAVLAPSICYEGAGRAVLEAYASGVPVLASRIGGLTEAVQDGGSGLLVAPGDPGAWAAAIDRLADDDLSVRLGVGAAALWRERFTPEHGLTELEAAYHDAMFRARGRTAA
jgi:glycosyltransferase involved in cell wall biosynthesis